MDFYIKSGFIIVGRVYIKVQIMSNLGSHGGSNREAPEVSSHYVASPDDIGVYIRRERESVSPLSQLLVVLSLWKIGPGLCPRTLELSLYLKILK